MSPQAEIIDEGLRMLEDAQGNPTFVYLGRHWPCSAGALTRGMDLGLGPPVNQLSRAITVRKSAMPIQTEDSNEEPTADDDATTVDNNVMPPHPGKIVLYQQRQYEVESVVETDAAWRVNLVSPNS